MTRRQIARDAFEQIRFRLKGSTDAAVNVLLDRLLEGIKGTPRSWTGAHDARTRWPASCRASTRRCSTSCARTRTRGGRAYIATAAGAGDGRHTRAALVMDGAFGTRWEVDDGVYTGRLDGPFAYGEGKAEALRRVRRPSEGIDLEQSWAYTRLGLRPADAGVGRASGRRQPGRGARRDRPARGLGGAALREARQRLRIAGAVLIAAAVGGSGSWLAARRRARARRGRLRPRMR